jgi:hypothetical protein
MARKEAESARAGGIPLPSADSETARAGSVGQDWKYSLLRTMLRLNADGAR